MAPYNYTDSTALVMIYSRHFSFIGAYKEPFFQQFFI